ncbi:hypothetical protein ACOSP7_022383 [Xanthoceras sorbifolium]
MWVDWDSGIWESLIRLCLQSSVGNSLVARVMRGCYYPNGNFLMAAKKASGSYVWRSLMWGRELLEVGSCWHIGDGNSILIYKDRWISRPSKFQILSPPVLVEFAMVDQLKNVSSGWNEVFIRNSFSFDDDQAIFCIPPSLSHLGDSLCWHYDSSRNYTVKSGYWVGMKIARSAGYSGLSGNDCNDSWWQFLWSLNIPSKVKLFIWRACLHWIPCVQVLAGRGMKVDVCYQLCGSNIEYASHALWGCFSLKGVREAFGLIQGIGRIDALPFMDLVLLCKSLLLVENFELLCIVFYRIWFRRNKFNHGGGLLSVGDLVGWSKLFLSEYHTARESLNTVMVLSSSPLIWCPPPTSLLKLNTDAAVRSSSGLMGFGIAVWNSQGWVLGSSAQFYRADFSALLAEATTLLRGLQFMATAGWPVGVMESDCLQLVNAINSSSVQLSDLGIVLHDIWNLLASSPRHCVQFVPRQANSVAHGLAKFACSLSSNMFWIDDCLESCVLANKPE